jgi:hypothetical protein
LDIRSVVNFTSSLTASVPLRVPGDIKQNRFVTPFLPSEQHKHKEVREMIDHVMKEHHCKRKDSPQVPETGFDPLLFLNFV